MRIFKITRFAAGAFAALALLTACTGKTGSGTTSGSASPVPTGEAADNGAPKVPAPLDADGILADPCSALSAAQQDDIGMVKPGSAEQGPTGPECRWKSTASPLNSAEVSPFTANKNGLSDIYAQKASSAYFEPLTIAGYPAVSTNVSDLRSDGDCPLWVGVSDQLVVVVTAQLGEGKNRATPCVVAQRVAEAMIQHLKGAA
ncbi:DUF3558 domain-containing protein [Amycolatopsis sp. NPDC049252]|uniref:DUF3558 domain-containing protein n=1 Tax=Amycolatopsis sp. NPDC049252 TaxID=3363933 RepID=UPI00370FBB75